MYEEAPLISQALQAAQTVVVLQADNPDGDSIGSTLALEHILGDMGKDVHLYCGVDIPTYLTYLEGWDRIEKELPAQFDLSIIVDTGADSLFEQLEKTGQFKRLSEKPSIVIDHHDVEKPLSFATVTCNKTAVATGEVIYELAGQLDWPLSIPAGTMLATAILSDSLGLTTQATTARSIHVIGELVEKGVSIPDLETKRKSLMNKAPTLVRYKGELLQRIEYYSDDRVASITIPWKEIEMYSPLYNPSMLVIDDMRMTVNTAVAIAFKTYREGRITAKIRCNNGAPIAKDLAEHFGGGGHVYASGFKVQDGRPFNEIKSECIGFAIELLDNLKQEMQERSHETIQHADA
jgi:bifunctional oligoribonuclease and PAP phosphatase NrnA